MSRISRLSREQLDELADRAAEDVCLGRAERTLNYATVALAMGQVTGASLPTIAKLAFGVRSALERVEGLTVTATGETIQ